MAEWLSVVSWREHHQQNNSHHQNNNNNLYRSLFLFLSCVSVHLSLYYKVAITPYTSQRTEPSHIRYQHTHTHTHIMMNIAIIFVETIYFSGFCVWLQKLLLLLFYGWMRTNKIHLIIMSVDRKWCVRISHCGSRCERLNVSISANSKTFITKCHVCKR